MNDAAGKPIDTTTMSLDEHRAVFEKPPVTREKPKRGAAAAQEERDAALMVGRLPLDVALLRLTLQALRERSPRTTGDLCTVMGCRTTSACRHYLKYWERAGIIRAGATGASRTGGAFWDLGETQ